MPASDEGEIKPSDSIEQPKAELEETEKSALGLAPREQKPIAGPSRDISLSTFVHLLGLPTAVQISLLETKMDVLTAKVTTLGSKLDRILAELDAVKNDAAVDRIDFQMTEIRSLLRRLVPAAAAMGEIETKQQPPKLQSAKAKVLSSEPKAGAKPETKILEKDNLEAENATADDEAYQQSEGRRIRQQTNEKA
ncbi:MAG: hypothetical protein U0136_20225 [Bdellovibrionota bacterium]